MGVLVLGAGGHAKVVCDILLANNTEVIGLLDDAPATWGTTILGLPVIGKIDEYLTYKPSGLILGIGSNRVRKMIVERMGEAASELWCNAVHPSAVIAQSARLGQGIVIGAQAVVNPDAIIGHHTIINTAATVDHDCELGAYVHLAPGTHLAGSITVGEGVLMGVGSQALPNISIGAWAVVGAGATVVKSVPDNVTAKGTPARW